MLYRKTVYSTVHGCICFTLESITCTCCKTFPFVCSDLRMAHGPLEGTFYCPEAPTVINELQLPLDPKQQKYVDTICKSYPYRLLKAIFIAIDQRMKLLMFSPMTMRLS